MKREQAEALLMLGVRQTGDTLVWPRRDGEPLQPQSLTHEFPRCLARLGSDFPNIIPKITIILLQVPETYIINLNKLPISVLSVVLFPVPTTTP